MTPLDDRMRLPQLDGSIFLSDGGLETTLIFEDGFELPMFEAFTLLESQRGIAALRSYFSNYLAIAARERTGFVLDTPTWRANPDWGTKVGYHKAQLADANRAAVGFMRAVRKDYAGEVSPIVVSGCIGPRGDGYDPGNVMRSDEAEAYHSWQIGIFKEAGVDLVSAFTLTNIAEAVGIAVAARAAEMPCTISFTLETDGKLPTGETLAAAITAVDQATDSAPAYYMINCAHPTHFSGALEDGTEWMQRIRGVRANSSRRSHAELDNATELDSGNPAELGQEYAALRRRFPQLTVLGGCCGTDHRHLSSIARACASDGRVVHPA